MTVPQNYERPESNLDAQSWILLVGSCIEACALAAFCSIKLIEALNYRKNGPKCYTCKKRAMIDDVCQHCDERCVCAHTRRYHRHQNCILCFLVAEPDDVCDVFVATYSDEYKLATAYLGEDYFE